jgi:hypothetical protein
MPRFRTEEEFEAVYDAGLLDDEYAEYIMENCHGERVIGNGDALVIAMEQGYLYEAFMDSMIEDNHYYGA